jgi:putative nucleotidyltransferase-like protein
MTAPPSARARLRGWLVSGGPPAPVDEADAASLADAAREQRLIALLHAAIAAEPAGWPSAVRERLLDEQRRLLVQTVAGLDTMARVSAVLAARGLRALPLKGAAVAESLYDSPAERPMGDVDVLALGEFAPSVRALEEAGFAIEERADHAWSLADPVSRRPVEMHRSVTSCPGLFPLDVAGLWARSRERGGQVQRVPSPEDLLVQLALHALFQHGGVLTLGQWLDFRRLLERAAPDPARVMEVAAAACATACLAAAVAAASAIVGGPEPALPLDRVPADVRRWVESVRRDPLSAVVPARPALARLRWALARGRRWALVTGTLRPPTDAPERSALGSGAALARRAAGLVWRYARRP